MLRTLSFFFLFFVLMLVTGVYQNEQNSLITHFHSDGWSIRMECAIGELCYKGTIFQNNYRKITILQRT